LLTAAGRDGLVSAELSAAGRRYVDAALGRIDELTAEIDPVRTQLVNFARRQAGCRALQARHFGVGWLCAAIIWAEIGDARRFSVSDQVVRFAGLDITVYSSDNKRSPGHFSRQGFPGAAVGRIRGRPLCCPQSLTGLRLLPAPGRRPAKR
jgi:transposase